MTTLGDIATCGTDAAYRRHLANGEDCPTCRTAHNERARQDDKKRARARAQSRALKALARCFPIEYNAFYLQELAEEGCAPRRQRGGGVTEEKRYTLKEARRELNRRECTTRGHDTEVICSGLSNEPVGVVCRRCTASWAIQPKEGT